MNRSWGILYFATLAAALPVSIAASSILFFPVLSLYVLGAAWTFRRFPPVWGLIEKSFVVFWGLSILSALLSGDPLRGTHGLSKDLYMSMFLVVSILVSAEKDRVLLLRVFVASGVVMAVLGLLQFLIGIIQWDSHDRAFQNVPPVMRSWPPALLDLLATIGGRSAGTRSHPITYAETLLLCLAGAMGGWAAFPSQRWRWGIAAYLLIGGILVSQSRGPWMVILMMAVVGYAIISNFPGHRHSLWGLVLIVIPFLLVVVSPSLRSRAGTLQDPSYNSNAERWRMWRVGAELIRQHPFWGVGPGHVKKAALPYETEKEREGGGWGHLHNTFIHMAAERGLLVLVAFGVFMVSFYRSLQTALRSTDPVPRGLALAGILAITAFLGSGLTERTWGDTEIMMMFFFLLGISVPVRPSRRVQDV